MSTAVITIVSGRHRHLINQRAGLLAGHVVPDVHVVVAMEDPEVVSSAERVALTTAFTDLPTRRDRLPLAQARNVGASLALERGADVLIFLDVDCIPGPRLVERYQRAVEAHQQRLLCGPVAYLPPPPPQGYRLTDVSALAVPHPLRPVPAERDVLVGGDPNLFWALSFATSKACWLGLGGFCERYEGYGAEDTDFAQLAARNGISLIWVGGAWAYHQHHGSQEPPVRHLADILRNASIFRERWGWWPMQGWLEEFQTRGLAAYDASTDCWFPT
jgi:hypothetical protein